MTMTSLQLSKQLENAEMTRIALLWKIDGEQEKARSVFAGDKRENELAEEHTF